MIKCLIQKDAVLGSVSKSVRERTFTPIHLIDMLITEDCNCRCDYCFIRGKRPRRMTEEIASATLFFALEMQVPVALS